MADNRDTIRERMLSILDDRFDKLPGTWTWEVYQSASIEFESHGIQLEDGVNQRFAGTADFENLKVIAFDRGVIWKDATKANGTVKVTGTVGAKINIGDLFASSLNQYASTEEKTIDSSGIAYVKVECTVAGSVGNTPINTIVNFPKTLIGINAVTNETAFTNGYEAETRDELLERYYLNIRKPSTSGNIYDYEKWALSVEGVGSVKIKPTWNGGGTVKIVILDRNKEPADSTLITNTFNYIETVRPVGPTITISTATEVPININCKITLLQDYTLDQAKQTIQTNLENYFKENAFVNFNVYYAKVGNIIFDSLGVNNIDYSTFTMNNAKSDIILLDTNQVTQIPKVGTLTITV